MSNLKIPANIGKPIRNFDDEIELDSIYRKYLDDPTKAGEIRELTKEEVENTPSWLILLSTEEEEELLRDFKQWDRVELYWTHRLANSEESLADFLKRVKEERKQAEEFYANSRNNSNDLSRSK